MDYLQAALLVAEEEVIEARASASAARVRAYGKFSTTVNSYYWVFVLGL
jgi:hypothetical protein